MKCCLLYTVAQNRQTKLWLERTPCCIYYIFSGHSLGGQGEGYSVGCNTARCHEIGHTRPLRLECQITKVICVTLCKIKIQHLFECFCHTNKKIKLPNKII